MESNKDYLYKADVQLRVRYSETDQMGFCYYGNYAQYFEVGRVETLRKIGVSYKKMEEEGYMLPVSSYNVNFLLPARYDDLLTISTKVVRLKGVRLFFEYEVKNEKKQLVATAETVLVFVHKISMKPIAPPEDFVSLLNANS